jgi:hypothetical protein
MVDRDPRSKSASNQPHEADYLNWYLLPGLSAVLISFGLFGDTINFDAHKPGAMPPFWTSTATREAAAPRWTIRQDATAPSRPNVFAQLSTNAGESEFPLAVFDRVVCRDGDLSVKFKIVAGERRIKAAGLVWRYQDQRNYYLLHFSVDEKNIVLFHVQDGQAHALHTVSHDLRANQWYVAKVIFRGPRIRVLFGNRQLFDAVDDSITRSGKTALWTRGGTVAFFDDFRIDKKG